MKQENKKIKKKVWLEDKRKHRCVKSDDEATKILKNTIMLRAKYVLKYSYNHDKTINKSHTVEDIQ